MAEDVRAQPEEVVDLTDGSTLAQETTEAVTSEDVGRAPTARRVFAGTLAVLAIIFSIGAVEAVWVKTTLQDEGRFVATFGSLLQEDSVRSEVSSRIALRIVEDRDVQSFFSDRLPDQLQPLAAPLTAAAERMLATGADEVLKTQAATDAWQAALRISHNSVRLLLNGNDRALESSDGTVSIDLNELASTVIARLEARGVQLPDVNTDLGSIVILKSDQLASAQTAAQVINKAGWFMPLIAVLLIAGAIGFAFDRRRMVAVLGFGTAAGVLIWLAASRVVQNATLDGIDSDSTREAARAVWEAGTATRTSLLWALLVLGLVVGVGAWLAGPSAAESSRLAGATDRWRRPAAQEPSGFVVFLSEWKRAIEVGILVLGAAFVLFGPTPTGLSVLITAVVVLVLVVLVEIFAGPAPAPTP
jgi:hypothetical protein